MKQGRYLKMSLNQLYGDIDMTDAERREAARQFIQKWNGKGKDDEDDRSYWIDLLSRVTSND